MTLSNLISQGLSLKSSMSELCKCSTTIFEVELIGFVKKDPSDGTPHCS